MNQTQFSSLLEAIYAAALKELSWEQMILQINGAFRSNTGGFFVQNDQTGTGNELFLVGMEDGVMDKYAAHYCQINPWFSIPGMMDPNQIRTEQDIDIACKQAGFFGRTEFYNDWLRPHEMNHAIGGSLTTRGAWHLNFTMFRPTGEGAYSKQEVKQVSSLLPHLRRLMEISKIMQLAQARHHMLLQGLSELGVGVILLDKQHLILEANPIAEQIANAKDGLKFQHKKIKIIEQTGAAQLAKLLTSTTLNTVASPWFSILRPSELADYQMMVIHYPAQMFDLAHVAFLVLLIDPNHKKCLPRKLIQQRLKLTERETDIAELMLTGKNAKSIAQSLELSYESVRWYIKQICQKTGCKTQAEFIAQTLSQLALIF